MKSIAVYIRVSRVKQDLASQEGDLQAWAASQPEPVQWYRDKFSGKTMNRPGLDQLLSDCRRGKVSKIVVWRLDRLGRTAPGLVNLFAEIQELGIGFLSLRDCIDLGTASGRLFLNVLISIAQFETEMRAERIAAGIAAKRARGEAWMNGRPKGSNHKTTPEVRQAIHTLIDSGASVSAVARQLGLSRTTIYAVVRGLE